MAVAAGFEDVSVDAVAIITDEDAQVSGSVFELEIDIASVGMTKRIDNGFAPDAVDVIADDGAQGKGLAFDDEAKSDVVGLTDLLGNARETAFEIFRGFDGRAQTAKSITAFIDDLGHEFEDAVESGAGGRVFGELVDGDMKLHGGAEDALEESVMQFLGDASALGEALFKNVMKVLAHLVKPEAVEAEGDGRGGEQADETEPPTLPEGEFAFDDGGGKDVLGGKDVGGGRGMEIGADEESGIFHAGMSIVRPMGAGVNGSEGSIGEGLNPPLGVAASVENDALAGLTADDAAGNGAGFLGIVVSGEGNINEFDGWTGSG